MNRRIARIITYYKTWNVIFRPILFPTWQNSQDEQISAPSNNDLQRIQYRGFVGSNLDNGSINSPDTYFAEVVLVIEAVNPRRDKLEDLNLGAESIVDLVTAGEVRYGHPLRSAACGESIVLGQPPVIERYGYHTQNKYLMDHIKQEKRIDRMGATIYNSFPAIFATASNLRCGAMAAEATSIFMSGDFTHFAIETNQGVFEDELDEC